ncbi:MAG: diaminopropionate ammonia-lyase, partial [Candidatus Marinimicrobia bacterium]|nr:diaminopropionate ammonia-lyase [Candidatus Neomarinimicrobiota bacterium]
VGSILIKDESYRFGLNAFKVLGASYAMKKQLEQNPDITTFCTATDGNHGLAVAWMAQKIKRKAIIYMPKGSARDRVNAIKDMNAEVIVINKGYDTAVGIANKRVMQGNTEVNNSWSLIQDTAWGGYEKIPLDIMKGYWTQMHEITSQINDKKIDFIFLQTGVGSWAASIISYILNNWDYAPSFISVEPFSANCLFESIKAGKRVKVTKNETTCMAGLDCGTVSMLAWQILKNSITASISISDNLTEEAMRILSNPIKNDSIIIAGESGASGLGALIALKNDKKYNLLNANLNILIINTEGDTDKDNYNKIMKG